MIKQLYEVLELTKIIYSNNWTTESNYVYFKNNELWTGNTIGDELTEDEVVIYHTFTTPLPFSNLGIPTAKFFATLRVISENATIIQKEDHLLIEDGSKSIKIPTVDYVESPNVDLNGLQYVLVKEMKESPKSMLQFVDKTDIDGGRVHFRTDFMYTTDRNSFYKTPSIIDDNIAVSIPVFNAVVKFNEYCIDDYLYLRKGNTTAVTRFYDPVEVSFLDDLGESGERLSIPDIIDKELFKIYNANTKKPDREVNVDICEGIIHCKSGNDNAGLVSVEGEINTDWSGSFTCNIEKFTSLVNDTVEVYIWDEVLECIYENGTRYIAVEVE